MTMTTPDTFTLLDPSAAPLNLYTLKAYIERHGVTERTVRRWLAAGELPGARQMSDGAWAIPADAVRTVGHRAEVVAIGGERQVSSPVSLSAMLDEQPAMLAVDVAARLLGVTEYAVRRMRADLGGLPIGPRGALMIPQAAVRRLAGL